MTRSTVWMRGIGCVAMCWLASTGSAQAAAPLTCPPDARLSEVTTADGTEAWCALPDGTRHGPSEKRTATGHVVERGYWEDGERQGNWRYYDTNGRIIRTGQMSAGKPTGAWTHFSNDNDSNNDNEPSATITHGQFPAPVKAAPQPTDPRFRWQLELGDTPTAWWPLTDHTVAIAIGTRRLVVASVETGAIEADIALPAPLRPDLHFDGGRILGVTGPGELFVVELDPGGGGSWQRIRTPIGVTHALAASHDREVVVRAGNGRLAGIDLDTGETTWSARLFLGDLRPLADDRLAIGVRASREVRAVTVGDGAFAWQARMPATVLALGATPQHILVSLKGGGVQALDRATGAPIWDLSLPLPANVQPQWAQHGPDTWLTTPGEAWRIDPIRGVVLEHQTARPPPEQAAAELAVGRHHACTTGRQGGLRCMPGDWVLPTAAPALPPLVQPGTILLAEPSGRIVAVDPSLTTAIESGTLFDAEVLVDEPLDISVEWMGERVDHSVPWVVVERTRADEDCSVTTAAVQLPLPSELWPADPTDEPAAASDSEAPPATLWIDDLVLYDDLGEGAFQVHPDWETESAGTTWRMSWWHRHQPTLAALTVTLGDNTDPAEVDALVQCAAPPAEFAGEAVLENGMRTWRIAGRLAVTPHPHTLDGEPGCLLDIALGGVDQGAWSSPLVPAWSEVVVEVHSAEAPDLPLDPTIVSFPPTLSGRVLVDAYEPAASERTAVTLDGVVDLSVQETSLFGSVLRAFSGGELLLEVPVPDLSYGQVTLDDDGLLQPTPTLDEHVDLVRDIAFDAPPDTWRLLWSRTSCDADLDVQTPDDAPDSSAAPSEAPPTATVRPTPLPPARSRWRRSRPSRPTEPTPP